MFFSVHVYLINMRNKPHVVNHETIQTELDFLKFRLTDALDDIFATANKKQKINEAR